jgi:drug/metabolite transporter (DMT)-like permease
MRYLHSAPDLNWDKGQNMTAQSHPDNKPLAILCAASAVGIASSGDALVKWMSGTYPVHELLFIRCLVGMPILAAIVYRQASFAAMAAPGSWLSILRGFIMCSAYLAFVLSMAAIPMADTVAIYFAMPLIVAALAWPLLGEHVRLHRWIAIIAGLAGVIIMVDPGRGALQPAALLALYAAFAYALSQSLARRIMRMLPPAIMAFHANAVYFAVAAALAVTFAVLNLQGVEQKSLAFLVRPWSFPPAVDLAAIAVVGTTVAFAMVLFSTAYKYAESSFVAPFEYTAMLWAVVLGFVVFGDIPGLRTLWGGMVVVGAGLFMLWMDRRFKNADAAARNNILSHLKRRKAA